MVSSGRVKEEFGRDLGESSDFQRLNVTFYEHQAGQEHHQSVRSSFCSFVVRIRGGPVGMWVNFCASEEDGAWHVWID